MSFEGRVDLVAWDRLSEALVLLAGHLAGAAAVAEALEALVGLLKRMVDLLNVVEQVIVVSARHWRLALGNGHIFLAEALRCELRAADVLLELPHDLLVDDVDGLIDARLLVGGFQVPR